MNQDASLFTAHATPGDGPRPDCDEEAALAFDAAIDAHIAVMKVGLTVATLALRIFDGAPDGANGTMGIRNRRMMSACRVAKSAARILAEAASLVDLTAYCVKDDQ